jgi:hypothetical protein
VNFSFPFPSFVDPLLFVSVTYCSEKEKKTSVDMGHLSRSRQTDRNEATNARWMAESAISDKVQGPNLWVN